MKLWGVVLLVWVASALGQETAKVPLHRSPEVNADRSITFRYLGAGASKVEVEIDWLNKKVPMVKGADGVWSFTTAPLPPQIYSYSFYVDGEQIFDPGNLDVAPNLVYHDNMVEVPGSGQELWDVTPVPHGEVHRHVYTTKVLVGLRQAQEPYMVYTPPGYDAHAAKPYPVLYLLHGWSQTEAGWTSTEKAALILDNLLAAGKIKPMVVVMPQGYGDMSFVERHEIWEHKEPVDHNTRLFGQALLTEMLPRVEAEYRVARDREGRAIAGLSMGGLESLSVGLGNPDKFAWVGGFSSAVHLFAYPNPVAGLDPKTAKLRLLWIACGTEDSLIEPNRKLVTYLKGAGVPVTAVETPGAHVSQVWRWNLAEFAQLLFR
ncbi:esterase [Granulicella sp. WH15]|uniref:esterase n=1 Tax=Granulicella sp. WH15 TaxID=2602070 RepID=UPI0013679612|nr:esterase [Granulicella sp. WH15]QHN04822.1 esterase [Granulicella sp. WH15]